jgi:hypothetical protein
VYLEGEDFMGYVDKMAYFSRKWTSDIVLRDHDYVCVFSVLLVIGGVEKNPGPGIKGEKICANFV